MEAVDKAELARFIREQFEAEPLPQSAVDGLERLATPGPWKPITPEGAWANYGGTEPLGWRSGPGGLVTLRGFVKNAGAPYGTVIGVLPAGIRPKKFLDFSTGTEITASRIQIEADGRLVYFGEKADYVPVNFSFWPGS
jgi:hypothetical protein